MKIQAIIKYLSLVSLVIFCYSFTFPVINKDKEIEAEKYYQKARAYYEKGENQLAVKQLKTAIKLNSKLAKAHYQLALIYIDEGTVYGRFKATIELKKALKLEPRNIEFLFSEAMLNIKKGFTYAAERQFKRIVKLDPNNYWAYYHLALLKEEEMLHYQDMISVEQGSDGIIFMDSFAHDLQEKAADYYKQAIAVNPKFSDAYYRLALIYYEFDHYDAMIQLLESAVNIIPDDKNCHLFLGFAYQNIGNFYLAADEYQLAKELMKPAEKNELESIKVILTPDQEEKYELITPFEKGLFEQAFWTSKDPFYLTEVNERELEHFSRIAYANLRFSKPEKNIEGWQTDRGKVLIRYGKPKFKCRTRPYLGSFTGNGRNPLHHSKELWIYPDFHFIFEDPYLSENFTFAWGNRPETDYKIIYNEMIKVQPDYYKLIPDSQLFDVPFEIVAFQGQNGKTELEFCYSIPTDKIITATSEKEHYNLLQGIFFFDQIWNPVVKRIKEISFQTKDISTLNSQPYYSSHEPIELNPGSYYFSLEFEDNHSQKRAKVHKEVQVDTFFSNQFQISDILFADDLQPPNLNVPPSRSDFKFIPNPLRVYQMGQPVVIYYEIYNLTQNQAGETHFKIEYRIGKDFESESPIKKLLTTMGIRKKGGEVTAEYEYTGNAPLELQYQNLMLDANITGKIMISLKATDLLTGSFAEKQETLTVFK